MSSPPHVRVRLPINLPILAYPTAHMARIWARIYARKEERRCLRRVSAANLRGAVHQLAVFAFEFVDFIAEAGGVLKTQFGGSLVHLLFEALDEAAEVIER